MLYVENVSLTYLDLISRRNRARMRCVIFIIYNIPFHSSFEDREDRRISSCTLSYPY